MGMDIVVSSEETKNKRLTKQPVGSQPELKRIEIRLHPTLLLAAEAPLSSGRLEDNRRSCCSRLPALHRGSPTSFCMAVNHPVSLIVRNDCSRLVLQICRQIDHRSELESENSLRHLTAAFGYHEQNPTLDSEVKIARNHFPNPN